MPRPFRNFLKKRKSSKSNNSVKKRYSSDSSGADKYEYGSVESEQQGTYKRWNLSEKINKMGAPHRSSRSLGDAELNGRLMSQMESDSNDTEEDDYFEASKIIERKFGGGGNNFGGLANSTASSGDDDDDDDDDEVDEEDRSSTDGLQELDRACVRLDGIEVYAIVSALTCATAINCFDNYEPTPLAVIVKERAVFTLLAEMFYYLSGALGMMTGLHATLIFSLVTMYGRTALGIDRDDAFNDFFANTGPARFNGFWSFKLSLYCFMTQLSFLIGRKFFFEPLRPLVLLATGYLSYTNLYNDAENVLSAASVIYSPMPTPPSPPPEEETVDPKDRRASMMKMKKRNSVKAKGTSLSTRNFGIDTSGSRRASFVFSKKGSSKFAVSTPSFNNPSFSGD